MTQFRVTFPNLEATAPLEDYMRDMGRPGFMAHGQHHHFPSSADIPVLSATDAVRVYPLIRAYCSEVQIMRLERLILRGGLALPIPTLEPTASVDELVGLDRLVRNALHRAGVHTVAELTTRHTTDLPDIQIIGVGKRLQALIDCAHAHGLVFADEKK
jgi:hypothetical protein